MASVNVESQVWTSDDVPRFSLGEGVSKKGDKRSKQIVGAYLYSTKQRIKGRVTTLHRMGDAIVDGEKVAGECLVYGSGAINRRIILLPAGTLVRLTYKGEKDTGMDTPMKDISVEWPRGTKLLGKAPVLESLPDSDDDSDGDQPF